MDLKINIAEDKELREFIKHLIKGQVDAIAREEYQTMIREELTRKIKNMSNYEFERLLKEAFQIAAKDIVRESKGASEWDFDWVKPYVREMLEKMAVKQNWEKLIKEGVTANITKLLTLTK